jgi:hypothetical protein
MLQNIYVTFLGDDFLNKTWKEWYMEKSLES